MSGQKSDSGPDDLNRRAVLKRLGSGAGVVLAATSPAAADSTSRESGDEIASQPEYGSRSGGAATAGAKSTRRDDLDAPIEGRSGGAATAGPKRCTPIPIGPIKPDLCMEWQLDGDVKVSLTYEKFGKTYGGSYTLSEDSARYHANDFFIASPQQVEVTIEADFDEREVTAELRHCVVGTFNFGCNTISKTI